MQVSEWHNRSAKVGGIRRDCLREQGDPGARQLPRVSTSLARLSSLLSTLSPSFSSLSFSLSLPQSFFPTTYLCSLLSLSLFPRSFSFFLSFRCSVPFSLSLSLSPSSSRFQVIHKYLFLSPQPYAEHLLVFFPRSLARSFPLRFHKQRASLGLRMCTREASICMRD